MMKRGRPHGRRRVASHFPREIRILYEDDAVVALDKPPGLLAVPIKGSSAPSALSLLSAELKTRRQQALVVHRIDRFTSGIILFAKTRRDREALVRQFRDHQPLREYLAVVRGHLQAPEGKLVHFFRKRGMSQQLTGERDPEAARAELDYRVAESFRGASLVRIRLKTGLQNQIRAQFLAIGHPVVGDRKYNSEEAAERRILRVALHATRLDFVHPRSGELVTLECGPPADFRSLLSALARPAGGK
jgi:23S rRNA pseudouridine1911/1915/1917 synthase